MTNTEVNPATDTATETMRNETVSKGTRKTKTQRRAAKTLAYFALIFTGLAVLAEPWLLIPVAALVPAISLWG